MATDDCAATIGDGAIDFCEGHHASGIAHGDNREKGVRRWAGNDVGCSGANGERGQVRVQVCVDCTLLLLGGQGMRGTVTRMMLVAGALAVRKWLVTPELRMAHCLMLVASVIIVLKRTEAARA